MFDKPGLFYSKDPATIFDNNWLLDRSKIAKLSQHNLSVLDFSSEHYGPDGIDYVYHALDESGINFLLLAHDPADHQKFDRMLFYPHWYHWARSNFALASANSNIRDYSWSCLNCNPRTHRIYNYLYSRQQSYFDSACFTFHDADISRDDDVELSLSAAEEWQQVRKTIPHRSVLQKLEYGLPPEKLCGHPANTNAYIHLVTETSVVDKIFITEKTWKPIAAGQLFLLFGNPGSVGYLRDQGVDVFDDIIDHSYDLTRDWQERLHQIHSQLQRLLCVDLHELYINTQQRRQTNIEKFFSGAFDRTYHQFLIQCINTPN